MLGWVGETLRETEEQQKILLRNSIYQFWPMFGLGKTPKTEAQEYQWDYQKVPSHVHFRHGLSVKESSSTHLPRPWKMINVNTIGKR